MWFSSVLGYLKFDRSATPGERQRRRGTAATRRPPFRPRLEALEDRTVPAFVFQVTNTGDNNGVDPGPGNGTGTLRQAIIDANYYDIAFTLDLIQFSGAGAAGTINLGSALPALSGPVNILGPGAAALTVRRNAASDFGIFTVNAGVSATLSDLTLSNGKADFGGGIFNQGSLTVDRCTLAGNSALDGAGIYNSSTGTLIVQNSTLASNPADLNGGGIYNNGTLTVQNSTLSGNKADQSGGGIYVYTAGSATLVHVTMTGNRADSFGSGSGGGLRVRGTATLTNTLVAGNFLGTGTSRSDVDGTVATASAGNLIGDGSGLSGISHNDANGNQVGGALAPLDPRLGPLAYNGGPTPTHALLPGSPALNAASASRALPADQRGVARDAAPDVGAFEFVPPPPPSPPSPPAPPRQIVAVAFKQKGKAKVRVKDAATGAVRAILTPFGGFTGRLRLLLLDVNGDGSADLMVKALIHGKLKKKVYDAVTLARLA